VAALVGSGGSCPYVAGAGATVQTAVAELLVMPSTALEADLALRLAWSTEHRTGRRILGPRIQSAVSLRKKFTELHRHGGAIQPPQGGRPEDPPIQQPLGCGAHVQSSATPVGVRQ